MRQVTRINFTKTTLAALPAAAPGSRVAYFDSRTRGLMLLVTAAGVKTFYVRRKLHGRSERICIDASRVVCGYDLFAQFMGPQRTASAAT